MTRDGYGPLLDQVRGLVWPSRRRAAGALPGTHASRRRGTAPELIEYRAYRQGDDPRRLDWKLLARTDRPFIRLADERAILPTIFVVDASASMDFPHGDRSKWALACRLTVGLSAVALAAGDPVGLSVTADDGAAWLAPLARRDAVHQIARALGGLSPRGTPPLLGPQLRGRQGARVVLISDFLGDEAATLRGGQEVIAAGNDVQAVHVVAREELDPTATALYVDPESPRTVRAYGADVSDGYRDRFAAWRAELARSWRLAGASLTEVVTDDDVVRAVRRVVSPAA
jgi:uncharacterized protein (DUF58 family)